MYCCASYWVIVRPARSSEPISANASSLIRWISTPASMCDCSAASSSTASNVCTSPAELTTSNPSERISSIVPPSTSDTYGMLFIGEYCIATVRAGVRISLRLACSSRHDR